MQLLIDLDEEYINAIDKIKFLVGGRTDRKLQLEIIKAIKNGKALEQEPCEDCVSRKAVLEMAKSYNADGWDMYTPLVVDVEDIEELPSVTPQEPRKGHWKHGKELCREYQGKTLVNITYEDWHCSNCHCVIEQSEKPKWNFCPNCGAKMEEVEE